MCGYDKSGPRMGYPESDEGESLEKVNCFEG